MPGVCPCSPFLMNVVLRPSELLSTVLGTQLVLGVKVPILFPRGTVVNYYSLGCLFLSAV